MSDEANEAKSTRPSAFVALIWFADSMRAALRVSIDFMTTPAWVAIFASVMATTFLSIAAMFVFKVPRSALIAGASAVAGAAVVRLTRLRPRERMVETRMMK